MESLFLAVICGCNAGEFREALHEIYIPRIQHGSACFAANVLGARGALLSVLTHFFEDGRWGYLATTDIEGQSLMAEDQLFVLMQAGMYLMSTRGLGTPEARICYERAESLCRSLNHPRLLCLALRGLWRYSIMTDKPSVALPIAERVYLLAQEQDDPMLMIGAYNSLACTLYYLCDFESARQYAMRAVQIWRSGSVKSHPEDFDMPVVGCLCFEAMSEWHLGNIASCRTAIAEAISLAKEINDTNALIHALNIAACLAYQQRNPAETERLAAELIELSTRYNLVIFLTVGTILRGWACSAAGDTVEGISWIEQGTEDYRASGTMIGLSYFLGVKAEALHLADRTSEALEVILEAEAIVERSGFRDWHAELHRLRGVFLTAMGAQETQIDASFCAAIRIAREQKSISLEKRAGGTYAEYRRQKANASGGRGFRLTLW
jgi:tetratricopeptide (TPR) repeat protein